ncbi:AMP-binding protein [Alteribacillus sp. YIM 98480]|uniref:AMP-binding enzyme n=1 Tax=Alteribacillus sp. YIM 98480 TaxID=2606599 RepID=UPI00131C220E|nr:AMP-binding protein [Alteribacillus sp. YIM 98480]
MMELKEQKKKSNKKVFTGDLAVMNEDGYFFIVGRKKDLIIASGYSVCPSEAEEVICQHTAIKKACVFGLPSAYRGETVNAVIVSNPHTLDETADIAF